ncbi:MAG: RecX family transcriptional regulator [Bacteroidales bacterium]|nr:RecX family transcriptional regulator [Bacteroidales bacterium]
MNSDPDPKKLLERYERQCARMEYCSSDIRRKALKALGGDADAAEKIVASLVKDGFVDDRRYAGAFVREKSALQGWGEAKLRFMLAGKGISRDVIADALTEIDAEKASARLEKLLQAKARTLEGDPAFRLKLLKFGLSRGYAYDEVDAAIRSL